MSTDFTSGPKKRIVITGGSGVVGRYVIQKLLSYGHEILNVDQTPLDNPNVHTLKADLTDGAQAFNALSCHFQISEPFLEEMRTPDVVIHLAGIPQPNRIPDNETFRINTLSSYAIIEAACKLGIKKIILASSITVYGVTYAETNISFPHFPITESTPTEPMDVYATSKVCMERVAASFEKRFRAMGKPVDIYCLRIGAVVTPDRHQEVMTSYLERPREWKVHGWSYIDARDLGNVINRCIETDGLGFEVFNVVNDENTLPDGKAQTIDWLRSFCPETEILDEQALRGQMAPISNEKAKRLLGFREEYPWREERRKWVAREIREER
ncbi:UDP-glucose 4-epimerase [Macroventuria anomochaeta]|uniref:UDP-glucose 4-epimerase n=1 Tax=Macroventuria anomochaeta TaxID=301207 RepID=A0ACB6S985_9PLEO|nr:UDP-glucose 4-epimerase [Macroventuria anomochaeta]KAF2630766.1 UDP-glucose 4-epimerase [Macroventuria anomochaeta]